MKKSSTQTDHGCLRAFEQCVEMLRLHNWGDMLTGSGHLLLLVAGFHEIRIAQYCYLELLAMYFINW